MRIFTASHAYASVPAWRDALDAESHIVQFPILLVAQTKKAASEMLTAMDLSEGFAQSLVRETRASTFPGRDWQMVLEQGSIGVEEPGIYLSQGGRKGSKVVRVLSIDEAEVVGEFDYEPPARGRGLYFTPAQSR